MNYLLQKKQFEDLHEEVKYLNDQLMIGWELISVIKINYIRQYYFKKI